MSTKTAEELLESMLDEQKKLNIDLQNQNNVLQVENSNLKTQSNDLQLKNTDLTTRLENAKNIVVCIINTVIISFICILIGFYVIASISQTHNIKSIKTDISGVSESSFGNSTALDFSPVLNKPDKSIYSNVWGEENLTINSKGEMDIKFPKGSYSPSSEPVGGAGFIYNLTSLKPNLTEAKLSYKLKFEKGFDFVKGGKLPGFCGGSCPRGGADASEGFSTRFMWRKKGDLELYPYLPTKTGKYGESFGKGSFRFETGKYYKIEQTIKLNTPDKDDGVMIIYVDGEEVYRNEKMVFRNSSDISIDSILFSTFFGGSDTSWATPNDTGITFKDFNLSY